MPRSLHRRDLLKGSALGLLGAALPDPPRAAAQQLAVSQAAGLGPKFSFDTMIETARAAARAPFQAVSIGSDDILQRIDYDAYQKIRFKRDASLQLGPDGAYPVQLFHLGQLFREPVRINELSGDMARLVAYDNALFDIPAGHPAEALPDTTGFAGFRVMGPAQANDWLSFLGASYFRASGPYNQYGLSARGLAVDTGLDRAEEFPRFTEFWLGAENRAGAPLTVHALLDSRSVTGAYRITAERQTDARDVHKVIMTVDATICARADIERLGVAPFSSMFWYGEAARKEAADWRPEIHDSDGLAIHTGSGERIWRPIANPPRVITNAFLDRDPKGFGLLQRDRDFVHYLDDGVFYERRPSVWVEPLDAWGEGAVHLLEIPTSDETFDNIVAYWCPKQPMRAGEERRFRYRLTWLDDIAFPETLGRATATWTGLGGRPGFKRPPGVKKFVVDFQGPVFAGLGRNDGVEIVVTASRGTVSNAYTHPVVDQRERWRAFFDLEAYGREPVDLRAFLRKGAIALTETWIYQDFPSV
ncbi:MAG: glucan biosynthesis protein [Hyphomicrobium sp.]